MIVEDTKIRIKWESHTSLRKFTNAILCPAIEYESISGDYKSLNSIQEQEMINITASNEKVKNKKMEVCNTKENRNMRRISTTKRKYQTIKLGSTILLSQKDMRISKL